MESDVESCSHSNVNTDQFDVSNRMMNFKKTTYRIRIVVQITSTSGTL